MPCQRPPIIRKGGKPLYDHKLEQSISRSKRRILELAICNQWDWFVTLTISPEYDRSDLNAWRSRFRDFVKYQRKLGRYIRYLLIPERHRDGAWHLHGFLAGDLELVSFRELLRSGRDVPHRLVVSGFYDWPAYSGRFGFCSLAPVRNQMSASLYIVKYVTKDMIRSVSELGAKVIRHRKPMRPVINIGEIYGRYADLDACLSQDFEFCATGMQYNSSDNLLFGKFAATVYEKLGYEPLFEAAESSLIDLESSEAEADYWQLGFCDI